MVTTAKVSPEAYLRLEREAEFRNEYVAGMIRPKPGATREQALINANIIGELHLQLKKSDCEMYGSKMKVRFPVSYRYPDVTIVRGTPLFEDAVTDVLLNPTVIFEVLPENNNRENRFAEYRHCESLQTYVLISQRVPCVEIYRRQGNDWLFSEITGLDNVLRLESIQCELKLSDIYDKVQFAQAEQA